MTEQQRRTTTPSVPIYKHSFIKDKRWTPIMIIKNESNMFPFQLHQHDWSLIFSHNNCKLSSSCWKKRLFLSFQLTYARLSQKIFKVKWVYLEKPLSFTVTKPNEFVTNDQILSKNAHLTLQSWFNLMEGFWNFQFQNLQIAIVEWMLNCIGFQSSS